MTFKINGEDGETVTLKERTFSVPGNLLATRLLNAMAQHVIATDTSLCGYKGFSLEEEEPIFFFAFDKQFPGLLKLELPHEILQPMEPRVPGRVY